MVLGFNHNLQYKGETFHVQTEDSGVANPHIITLLYRGGVILCSQKTSYSDILKMDNLDVVVEELMKEQHKNMMRRLKAGEFDDRAFSIKPQLIENYQIPTLEREREPDSVADLFGVSSGTRTASTGDISMLFEIPAKDSEQVAAKASDTPKPDTSKNVINLDDAVLSFFGNHEK